KYAGRPTKITPSAVAREARLSCNPLYTTHRALLSEIAAAAQRPSPAADLGGTIGRLEAKIAELHGDVRRLGTEKQLLATENLALLQRARGRPKIDWHLVIVNLQSCGADPAA